MSIKLAIYGYDTEIGKLILEVMDERGFEPERLYPLSPLKGEYDAVPYRGHNYMISCIDDFDFDQADIAVFACTKDETARLLPKLERSRCILIDNSRYLSGRGSAPGLLPELTGVKGIREVIDKRSCVPLSSIAAEIALALEPLSELKLSRVIATALMAVSEHGETGTQTLAHESVLLLNGMPVDDSPFDAQLAFNLHPRVGPLEDNGCSSLENLVTAELTEVLGSGFAGEFDLTCLQVPVFYGHTVVMNVELKEWKDFAEIKELLEESEYLRIIADDEDMPTPVSSLNDEGQVLITRLRPSRVNPNAFDLTLLMDNTRRGEAMSCVQLLELIAAELEG